MALVDYWALSLHLRKAAAWVGCWCVMTCILWIIVCYVRTKDVLLTSYLLAISDYMGPVHGLLWPVQIVWPVGMLKSFFLKNRLSFAKNRFFLDYRFWRHSAVTVGCSNMLGCREGWCSCRGGLWRGRPTNRLDTQTEQTASRTAW